MFILFALVRFLYLLLGQRWAVPYLPVTLVYSFFDPRLTPPPSFFFVRTPIRASAEEKRLVRVRGKRTTEATRRKRRNKKSNAQGYDTNKEVGCEDMCCYFLLRV